MPHNAPIILTATMGAADFAWADALRRAHFPPERNQVPAHITLFHHLPPSVEPELLGYMASLCKEAAPEAHVSGVLHLGNGVAFRVNSPALEALRYGLAEAFHGLLIPQDRATPRFHITVQNKVSTDEARTLLTALQAGFRARPLMISGLAAWRYMGGPWEPIRAMRFRG
ncbi:MAG TPA: 2'-5' RNA ligase family protein [Sphingobium sp.]